MKKLLSIVSGIIFIVATQTFAMHDESQRIHEIENSIIPHASYLIYEKSDGSRIVRGTQYVTFYTFDGEVIVTLQHHGKCMSHKLDPQAPKPQPISGKIVYLTSQEKYGVIKQVGGYFIYFYDRNQNILGKFRFEKKIRSILVISHDQSIETIELDVALKSSDFPLDLSLINDVLDQTVTLQSSSSQLASNKN